MMITAKQIDKETEKALSEIKPGSLFENARRETIILAGEKRKENLR